MYRVTETFTDWDGIKVEKGVEADQLLQCGYNKVNRDYFWNLVKAGSIVAVTIGRPPVETYRGTPQTSQYDRAGS